MGVDHFLDRDRTGHGRARSEQRRRRAQREAGRMPERLERVARTRRSADHLVEDRKVAALLGRHMLDCRPRGPAQDRQLAFVNRRAPYSPAWSTRIIPFDGLGGRRIAGRRRRTVLTRISSERRRRQPNSPNAKP